MNQELYQQILDYLNSAETETKLQGVLAADFDAGQKENFLKVWQKIKDLEFNIDDLYPFLIYLFNDDLEKAGRIDDALFENIFIEAYDELIDLYEENKKQEQVGIVSETEEIKETETSVAADLEQKYGVFANSSLFQNMLASEEMIKEKYWPGGQLGDMNGLKNDFYSAINAGDKIRTVGILRAVAGKGLKNFFENDQRYQSFFKGYLERHLGAKAVEEFLQNPLAKKHISEFIRFVLEKRVNLGHSEAAMIGAGLAALCQENNESEYADLAYGDEAKGEFGWGE